MSSLRIRDLGSEVPQVFTVEGGEPRNSTLEVQLFGSYLLVILSLCVIGPTRSGGRVGGLMTTIF